MKSRLTFSDEQVALVRALWATGESQSDIATALGVGIDQLKARLRDIPDLPKRPRRANSGRRGIDPTPEEIQAATAQIRAGWGPDRWLPEPREEQQTAAFLL